MVRSVGRGNGLGKVLCGRRQGGTRTQEEVSAMWETWVRFLGWEDPLEKGKGTHSSIFGISHEV